MAGGTTALDLEMRPDPEYRTIRCAWQVENQGRSLARGVSLTWFFKDQYFRGGSPKGTNVYKRVGVLTYDDIAGYGGGPSTPTLYSSVVVNLPLSGAPGAVYVYNGSQDAKIVVTSSRVGENNMSETVELTQAFTVTVTGSTDPVYDDGHQAEPAKVAPRHADVQTGSTVFSTAEKNPYIENAIDWSP